MFPTVVLVELYRVLSVGQKKEFLVQLTNRVREEDCSSTFLFLFVFSFSSLVFLLTYEENTREENPAGGRRCRRDVYTCVW